MSKQRSQQLIKALSGVLLSFVLVAAQDSASADPAEGSNPVRGVVRPQSQATISTDFQAPVAATKFKEGDRFRKGDLIIEFDCRRHQAELAAAEAQTLEMRLALENNVTLDKYKAVGKSDLEISRARVKRTEAEANGLRARLDQCRVIAPFDGRIAELAIL